MALPIIVPIAMMVAGAAMGKAKADAANRRRHDEMMARAQEQEGSPWTHMGPTTEVSGGASGFGEGFGGAMQGLSMAQGMGGMGGGGEAGAMGGAKVAEGNLDPNLTVGGQDTKFGNIGGTGLDQSSQQAVSQFNNPYQSKSMWTQMPGRKPSLYGG